MLLTVQTNMHVRNVTRLLHYDTRYVCDINELCLCATRCICNLVTHVTLVALGEIS